MLLSGATRALVDGELTDLGDHRLKDFAEPIKIFQLGRDRFPPLGVWIRPFRDIVYLTPPLTIGEADLAVLTSAIVQVVRSLP